MTITDILGTILSLLDQLGLTIYIKVALIIWLAFMFLSQLRKLRD